MTTKKYAKQLWYMSPEDKRHDMQEENNIKTINRESLITIVLNLHRAFAFRKTKGSLQEIALSHIEVIEKCLEAFKRWDINPLPNEHYLVTECSRTGESGCGCTKCCQVRATNQDAAEIDP